ncbi:hypothetical protein MKJ04_01070 [Pontibacter sp. E15-1]|uniref:hypothetical protein n=1 Tax=Pontibacter sp. E15-1 TaxID=2919918 RepID=UPI001F4F4315|nr:hypothetical protein [Pontibacter sp. E15-1]MCJ8163412.1 hypothetical protein [Pontibacter sp. E15-1]
MPQGKVIAVKPSYKSVQFAFENEGRLYETVASESTEDASRKSNLILIGVCKDDIASCDTRKVKAVVWYEDDKNEFDVGDYVDFDDDKTKKLTFEGAKNVKKIKHGKFRIPAFLLSNIALLASVFLIGMLVKDSRR